MNDTFGFMDLIFLAAAIYIGYHWYCLQIRGEIKTGILLNKEVDVEKCLDKQGYIREASPKLLLLAVTALAASVLCLLSSFGVLVVPLAVLIGVLALFMIVLIWVGFQGSRLYKKYWDTAKKSIKRGSQSVKK